MITDYREFLDRKRQQDADSGFDPVWMPDFLIDFQTALVEWSIRKGRAAIFADCGLGKTPMQLVWAQNVLRKTNRHVLILTPLAVAEQTVREGEKFGVECRRSKEGKLPRSPSIVVANYERLHHFRPDDFGSVVADESSILKNFDGSTKEAVTEFMRRMPYRLLCTATAAPNDYFELGTSSEALGYLGHRDMLTRFFKEEEAKDYLGWGRKTYKFRGHAEQPFWRWVCSWARTCRKPSDLGYDDGRFTLPPLKERELVLKVTRKVRGMLFALPARDMREQRAERRETLRRRCEEAARLAEAHDGPSVLWCHLNPEGDLLEDIVRDGVQIKGSMPIGLKEERLLAFQSGEIRRLITKPKIGCFGLNWQHCHNVICFPSHSWEQYYQAVRRCYRFGQEHEVVVTIVTTEGEQGVLANLRRKAVQADRMFDSLVGHVKDALEVRTDVNHSRALEVPPWLRANGNGKG